MIDFHTHILHAIDDGPGTLADAVRMARMAVADGTHTMVATPHAPGPRHHEVALIFERLEELRAALNDASVPLTLVAGSELHVHPELPAMLKAGTRIPCGNSRSILLECPIYECFPPHFEQVVGALQRADYRVVLAHPERITDVQQNPNVLIPLIERGVVMQLTSQALTGDQGEAAQRFAEGLLLHRLVHLVASDAHGVSYRPPLLSAARARAAELIGEADAAPLFDDVPRALLDNAPLALPTPRRVQQLSQHPFTTPL